MNERTFVTVPIGEYDHAAAKKSSICERVLHFRGYLFAISAAIFFPLTNLFIKKAYFLNSFEHLVIFFNNKLILLVILALVKRINPFGSSHSRTFLCVRAIVGLFAYIFLYIGLIIVPLSDSSAILNSSIIITAILSRIFLKEKLGPGHILALFMTIAGVLLISKPSFLYPTTTFTNGYNNTANHTSSKTEQSDSNCIFLIGITFTILASVFFGSLKVIVKQLCNCKVEWCVITIYDSYIGLPVAIALSYVIYNYKLLGPRDLTNVKLEFILLQIFYSSVSSVCSTIGSISLNLALKYEDATKVSIIKACDVVVAFLLQTIILRIKLDLLSLVGSLSILFGIVIVFIFKLAEKKLINRIEPQTCNQNKNKIKSIVSKFLTFKF